MIEHLLPEQIEQRSFEIIDGELKKRGNCAAQRAGNDYEKESFIRPQTLNIRIP